MAKNKGGKNMQFSGSAINLLKAGELLQKAADARIVELKKHFSEPDQGWPLDKFYIVSSILDNYKSYMDHLRGEVENYVDNQLKSVARLSDDGKWVKKEK